MTETYTEVSSSYEWRSPVWLWRLVCVCYAAAIALFVVLGAAEALILALHLGFTSISEGRALVFDQALLALNQFVFPVVAVCALVSLALLYRLVANAHTREPATKLTGPVLAVGAYFIPLLNLFMPPLIMAELWRATFESAGRQPKGVIALWWTALLIGAFTGTFANYASPESWADFDSAAKLYGASALSFAARAIAASALLYIFATLANEQESWPALPKRATAEA